MKCINCKESGKCLCWTCARPVIIYAITNELIHQIIRTFVGETK